MGSKLGCSCSAALGGQPRTVGPGDHSPPAVEEKITEIHRDRPSDGSVSEQVYIGGGDFHIPEHLRMTAGDNIHHVLSEPSSTSSLFGSAVLSQRSSATDLMPSSKPQSVTEIVVTRADGGQESLNLSSLALSRADSLVELVSADAKRVNQYLIGRLLGRGAHCKVKFCVSLLDGKPYVRLLVLSFRIHSSPLLVSFVSFALAYFGSAGSQDHDEIASFEAQTTFVDLYWRWWC